MSQFVPYVFFLACPLTMGAMMWFMMRGAGTGDKHEQSAPDARIAALEHEVRTMRASRADHETAESH